jgi:CBS domain-containing protein
VVTRRELLAADAGALSVAELVRRRPAVAFPENTLREAADHMVREGVGRLPVVDRESGRLVGIVSRSDLLAAHAPRLEAAEG